MAINQIFEQVVSYEVFCNGERFGNSSSVEWPDFTLKTQTISGAAIAGEYEATTLGSFESLELSITFRTLYTDVARLMRQEAVILSLRGAAQVYDAATGNLRGYPVRVDARGRVKSLEGAKFEPSELMEPSVKFELDMASIKVNNVEEIVVDKLNFIYRVHGTDYLAEIRTMLGI